MTPEEQAALDATANGDDDAAIAAEVAELTASPQDQQADKVKNALIAAKREKRDLARRVKELEPIAAQAQDIGGKLQKAQPIIDAVVSNPKLMAEALRIAGGGRPSSENTAQPTDDDEAKGYAEDSGWYLADGVTPDTARARRVIDRQMKAIRQVAEEVVRPYAGVTLSDRAERLIAQALHQTDKDGVPIASEQSIREIASKIPQHMLADPQIINVVLRQAAGEDRMQGRTPKAPDEPLFLEPAGSRRRAEPTITVDKDTLARVGLTEDEFKRGAKALDGSGGKSVVLGR